jgi:hypothetical protein
VRELGWRTRDGAMVGARGVSQRVPLAAHAGLVWGSSDFPRNFCATSARLSHWGLLRFLPVSCFGSCRSGKIGRRVVISRLQLSCACDFGGF